MDPRREKIIGFLLVIGAIGFVCGGILTWVFTVAGGFRMTATRNPITGAPTEGGTLNLVPLSLTLMFGSIILLIVCLFYGVVYQKKSVTGPRKVVENARVIARYAVGRNGEHLVEAYGLEDAARYYVRLQTGWNETYEYETSAENYYQCPEGAFGEAEIQRRWLGRFTVYIGERPEG